MVDELRLDAAEQFMLLNARLVDRLRFACLFRDAPTDAAVSALRPYQNADGGFGHALEPDGRTPFSQPLTTSLAFDMLDELDRFDDDLVLPACGYLDSISRADGGVPFVHPSIRPHPRAPWWQPDDGCLQGQMHGGQELARSKQQRCSTSPGHFWSRGWRPGSRPLQQTRSRSNAMDLRLGSRVPPAGEGAQSTRSLRL